MLEQGVKVQQRTFDQSQFDYLPFSVKFKRHFQSILNKHNDGVHFTFLSGSAGTGKSCTLQNEFLIPLQENHGKYYIFRFLPDQNIHNHFFLSTLTHTILQDTSISYKQDADILKNLQKLSDLLNLQTKEGPFDDRKAVEMFAEILSILSKQEKIYLVFEDIHYARKNFNDFCKVIDLHGAEINAHIFCTTRLKRDNQTISLAHSTQKWFYLEGLSKRNTERYLHFLEKRNSTNPGQADTIIGISGGNPFYIKELHLLHLQKSDDRRKEHFVPSAINLHNSNARSAITAIRFSYLNEESRTALKVLGTIGYDCQYNEAIDVLRLYRIENIEERLSQLEKSGFLSFSEGKISFQHHLLYESIKSEISDDQRTAISRTLFNYFFSKKSLPDYERLIHHAFGAQKYHHASALAKKFAEYLYNNAHHDLAADYYDLYLDVLKKSSSPGKLTERTIKALLPLHATCLILGRNAKAENIAVYLASVLNEGDVRKRYRIYSTLTTSYWTNGDLPKAKSLAIQNMRNADILNDRAAIISSTARYGTLCMEMADFDTAINMHGKVLSLISTSEKNEKFGMFVSAYPCSHAVRSICQYEIGRIDEARISASASYELCNSSTDDFTNLFIATHCGHAMTMIGHHEEALQYLDQALSRSRKNKTTLLMPAALSLSGLCLLSQNQHDLGHERIHEARDLMSQTFKDSKKGIVDLVWMESLLISYRTEEFKDNIDRIIEETKAMQQFSYLGWLYYLKAIYHAFFHSSIKGFVGAYAKASAIAENFRMGALTLQLQRLSQLEKSGIVAHKIYPENSALYNKAAFFHSMTENVKPIFFHIENGTRS